MTTNIFEFTPQLNVIEVVGPQNTIKVYPTSVGRPFMGVITPEDYGAAGDGVTDDRAAFQAAEASGYSPIVLTKSYYLSSNTGSTSDVYQLEGNATVTMGTGSFQPARYTDNKSVTTAQKVNFTATNPISTGEPVSYILLDTGYIDNKYLINQWGRQNMDLQNGGATRTGAYAERIRMNHSGEGDGYCTFWSTFVTAHPRVNLATRYGGQNSAGLGGGQTNAGSNKVNLYGFGDVVVHDQGYQDVALFNYVGITYYNGTESGTYGIPRTGIFSLSNGTNSIDTTFLAGGKTRIAYDATKADVDWGAFVMKAGQKVLFDATEAIVDTDGKFAATAPGEYYMMKSPSTSAIVVGRGADDADLFRVEGSSTTSRLSIGAAGTIGYISAHTTGSDSTTLSLRTYNAGVVGDRVVIGPGGNVNIGTSGARLQMAGVNVLNARQTGWTADTGTSKRTANATYSGTAEAVYTQATIQALMDKVRDLTQTVKALKDDMIAHGLIGS